MMERKVFSLICALGLGLGVLVAADDSSEYRAAYGLILNKEWDQAEKAFHTFTESYPNSQWADDAAFWTCYAKHKGRLTAEESFSCYEAFIRSWPESQWADDALRNLVVIGKQLAREGRPEFLNKARLMGEPDRDRKYSPEDEVIAMLAALEDDLSEEEQATQILRYLEKSQSEGLRQRLVLLCEDIHSERITQKLQELVLNDPSERVRNNAVEVLIDQESAWPFLLKMLKADETPTPLRKKILDNIGDDRVPSEVVTAVIGLISPTQPKDVAVAAIYALGDLERNEATQALYEVFGTVADRELKMRILNALADTETVDAMAHITRIALDGEDEDLSCRAVQSLDEFEAEKALPALSHILNATQSWRVKIAAVHTMGEYEDAQAVEILLPLVRKEGDPEIRIAAMNALAETNRKEVVSVLAKIAADDTDPKMRRAAIEALGDMDDVPEAKSTLLELLEAKIGKGD